MSRSPTDEKSFREECLDEERPSNVALQRSDRAIFESGPPKARAKASLSRAGQPSRQAEKQVPTTAAISSIQALSSQQLAPPSQGGFVSGNSHEKPSSDWKALATEFHLGIVATGTTEALDGGSANDRGQLQEDSSPTSFVSLAAFQAHIAQKREGLQVGRARFAGLTTLEEYKALLRVRSDQDIHALRKVMRYK